jgi:hypothetical protein
LRTEIDGVPVLWEQGPEPMTAALVLGVGVAKHLRGQERLVSLIDERAGRLLFTPEPEGRED